MAKKHWQPGDSYARVVFMVYWQDASPSAEVFYIGPHGIDNTPANFALLETMVIELIRLREQTTRVISATLLSYIPVSMRPDGISEADQWRIITTEEAST